MGEVSPISPFCLQKYFHHSTGVSPFEMMYRKKDAFPCSSRSRFCKASRLGVLLALQPQGLLVLCAQYVQVQGGGGGGGGKGVSPLPGDEICLGQNC